MSESEEDFAAMFEASIKTRRFTQGQTIEGTIVAIGPDVAFVDVGGKGEAVIEVAELKDDEGDIEVNVGDRIQAMVVSTVGRAHALARADAWCGDAAPARGRVQRRASRRRQGRRGGQGRIRGPHRPPARILPVLADRHAARYRIRRSISGRSTSSGSSSTRTAARTSSSRGGRFSKKSSGRRRSSSASPLCLAL